MRFWWKYESTFDSSDYAADINMSGVLGADRQYIGPSLRGRRSIAVECDKYSQYPPE